LQTSFKEKKKSGVLLHPTSLFGDFGIGGLGKEACEFCDLLADSGFKIWQTLPFSPPDKYSSPYKSPSLFGLNPYLIDPVSLYDKGYITKEELSSERAAALLSDGLSHIKSSRLELLFLAASRAAKNPTLCSEIDSLLSEWPELSASAEFLTLAEENGGAWQSFTKFEPDPKRLFARKFIYYEFLEEWKAVKNYANSKGIEIIGDVPIYVDLNSADVYFNRKNFLLDGNGFPTLVAGVPPDYFSSTGQLWGNPIYDYRYMEADGFSFWKRRMEYAAKLFDGVRIDHFRGFEHFYAIDGNATDARNGKWIKGPGRLLIDAIKPYTENKTVIAEDLGDITEEVNELRSYSSFLGTRVLQFAFFGDESSPHLPKNLTSDTAAYSGTHDNNTLFGYVSELDSVTRGRIFDYFGSRGASDKELCDTMIEALFKSKSSLVIFPIQDLLHLGSFARMNTPGTKDGNWTFRLRRGEFEKFDRKKYAELNTVYGR